jgi:hypothetical protein
MPSSSSFINGFGTNGLVPHVTEHEVQPYENGDQTASTSFSAVNGYAQWVLIELSELLCRILRAFRNIVIKFDLLLFVFSPPYQMHNEGIVNHLYNAGFQTGVRTCLLISPLLNIFTNVCVVDRIIPTLY